MCKHGRKHLQHQHQTEMRDRFLKIPWSATEGLLFCDSTGVGPGLNGLDMYRGLGTADSEGLLPNSTP